MIVAVKEGGSGIDPANNSRLASRHRQGTGGQYAQRQHQAYAWRRPPAAGAADNYESITYEGYGPGGVAVIVEAMTDNRNRTAGSCAASFR